MQTPDVTTAPAPLASQKALIETWGQALPLGARVGRFEIIRVLSQSVAATVYVAIDQDEQTEAVLKEYLPERLARRAGTRLVPQRADEAAAMAEGLRAFISEAQMLGGASHPSLMPVRSLLEGNGTAYAVMPYYFGNSMLRTRMAMVTPPDETAVRTLVDQLLGAIEALHNSGNLHGGIDPGNILLLADGRPLLLGPGSTNAVVASPLVATLMASVEPSFAAPELHKPTLDRPLGPWTDLYALAETIRFFITGVLPSPARAGPGRVRRESTLQLLQRLFGNSVATGYSLPLLDTIDAALDTLPDARPQSAAEFRDRLTKRVAAAPTPVDPTAAEPRPTVTQAPPVPTAQKLAAQTKPASTPTAGPQAAPKVVAGAQPAATVAQRASLAVIAHPARRRRVMIVGACVLGLMAAATLAGAWLLDQPARIDEPRLLAANVRAVSDGTPAATNAGGALPAAAAAAASATALPATVAESTPPAQAPAAPNPTGTSATAPGATPAQSTPPPSAQPAAATPAAPAPAAEPTPTLGPATAAPPAAAPRPTSPRAACGNRTQFALYRCMQTQCAQRAWAKHAQCEQLRSTDAVN